MKRKGKNRAEAEAGPSKRNESSASCTSVAPIIGHAGFAYVRRNSLECDHSALTEDSNNHAGMMEPTRASKKRKEAIASGDEERLIRSYGTFQHLVAKVLNSILASIEDEKRPVGTDVLKVGSTTHTFVGAIYLEPTKSHGIRSLCVVIDTNRRRNGMDKAVLVHFTMSHSFDYIVGCSCRYESLEDSCVHTDFLNGARLKKIIAFILAVRTRGSAKKETGVLQLPRTGKERFNYWVYFHRRVCSKYMTTAVLLVEKLPKLNSMAAKTVPLSLRIRCLQCRQEAESRDHCEHEKSVVDGAEMVPPSTEAPSINPEFRESVSWDLNGIDDILLNELLEDEVVEDTTENSAGMYESSKPRPFIRCAADDRMIELILERSAGKESSELWEGNWVEVWDVDEHCRKCDKVIHFDSDDKVDSIQRKVNYHGFRSGTMQIVVHDLICPFCNTLNIFDGRSWAMFSIRSDAVFSRELLDMWVYQVCGVGTPFREAYEIYYMFSLSISSLFERSQLPSKCHRRLGASAFAKFLKTLEFPTEKVLFQLFSCETCEKKQDDGTRRLDAVVMDGTAVGVLKRLPKFDRLHQLVPRVDKCTRKQFLIDTPQVQSLVDSIFRNSARKAADKNDAVIVVPLTAPIIEKNIQGFLFEGTGVVGKDHAHLGRMQAVIKFIQFTFARSLDLLEAAPVTSTYIYFKVEPVSVRLALCDVGRCFCAGSIPGGVLRDELAVEGAKSLAKSFNLFGFCDHSDEVCAMCVESLLQTCAAERDSVPSISKLGRAICESVTEAKFTNWRELALIVVDVLEQSLVVRSNFFELFEAERSYESRLYEVEHRDGRAINVPVQTNWLAEARLTGEIFPGRPIVRPRLEFGLTKRDENSRGCNKKYPVSQEHSPGIFTVQCCCPHPKILGISVMEVCEGVSMALSVLLSRFRNLPRVTYYDNACNLSKSVLVRCPWVNGKTRVAVDRFHYRGHTCCSVHDPSAYPSFTEHQTSNAEALNRLWSSSKNHSRHLDPENLMSFLSARAAFMNLRSLYRERTNSTDIEDANMLSFAQNILPCECHRCVDVIPNEN